MSEKDALEQAKKATEGPMDTPEITRRATVYALIAIAERLDALVETERSREQREGPPRYTPRPHGSGAGSED